MKISVIIGYYKNLPFLKLILNHLAIQTYKNFEVIIAEDAKDQDIADFIKNHTYDFEIKHVFHDDIGFRKCKILNQAILISSGTYLVFLDGDCIPHPKHLESYFKFSKLGICYGRRVMLSQEITEELIRDSKKSLNWMNLLISGSKQIKHAFYFRFKSPTIEKNKGIWGCNWGLPKQTILDVNGFDEDYTTAGIGEDVDIEWRLKKAGHSLYYLKHLAIVYHLNHPVHYNDAVVSIGQKQLKSKINEGFYYCKNGLKSNT